MRHTAKTSHWMKLPFYKYERYPTITIAISVKSAI